MQCNAILKLISLVAEEAVSFYVLQIMLLHYIY